MGRPRKTDDENVAEAQQNVRDAVLNEAKADPETATQNDGHDGEDRPAVKDLPPANPLGEPIDATYSEGKYAEITQGTFKPSETIVEHPLSPTDTNPNPHGQRSQPVATVIEANDKGVEHRKPAEEDVEVTGWHPNGVHVGDGRIIAYGETMKVGKDQAKDLQKAKKEQGF